jgi:3-isopropylmalate dehydrogenase
VAFQAARKRSKKVTSVDKANVLETFQFWKDVVTEVHAQYPDVELDHMYVDNAAMQLVKAPKALRRGGHRQHVRRHPVDEAAMLTGSIGMLPSGVAGQGQQGPVRAQPRQRARHRR